MIRSQFPLSGSDFVREFPRKSSENFVDNQACIDEFYRDIAELELDLTYQRMMGPNEPLSSTYLGYNLAYELRLPHPPLVRRSEEESRDRVKHIFLSYFYFSCALWIFSCCAQHLSSVIYPTCRFIFFCFRHIL